jgi:ferredoxin
MSALIVASASQNARSRRSSRDYSEAWPNIIRKGDSPEDAEKWEKVPNKLKDHFSPEPGEA